jgi:hypothetical protein
LSTLSTVFDILSDLRARVIFYSCISKPRNILEIAEIWGYKSSTYFYQKRSREIIEKMQERKLIQVIEGNRFKSNYDLVLDKKEVKKFFEQTNDEISKEIIIEKYDFEILPAQLEDPLFKEFCLEKKPKLKDIISAITISDEEVKDFLLLWKNPLFKELFLSTDIIKRLIEDRQRLPENPREFLFSLTASLCEEVYLFKEGGGISGFPQPYLWLDVSEVLHLLVSDLKPLVNKPLFDKLRKSFQRVYTIMRKKFVIYGGRSEVSAYHIAKFTEIMSV